MASKKKLTTPVVAVLNMKGGVGKTTISAYLFQAICEKKAKSVLLIDLDPQYNLSQLLLTGTDYDGLCDQRKTIRTVMEAPQYPSLFDPYPTPTPPPATVDVSTELFGLPGPPPARLTLVPGDFELIKFTLLPDARKSDLVKRRFVQFVQTARSEFDIICIDCNPSSSLLTLCALEACTDLLVPVRPDRYSLEGLDMILDYIGRIPTIDLPDRHILVNGTQRSGPLSSIEDQLRRHADFGPMTLGRSVHHSRFFQPDVDETGFAKQRRGRWGQVLDAELAALADEFYNRVQP
jgi:chromosome partitioning protein